MKHECPICKKATDSETDADFPFCSERCRLLDLGNWSSDRVGIYRKKKDPRVVVIDEVAGQLISYFGFATAATLALNWQYLLAGFILFRVFDIWKPFPARRAESLPGGLGIMADDWIAGIYAALGLWIARALGL